MGMNLEVVYEGEERLDLGALGWLSGVSTAEKKGSTWATSYRQLWSKNRNRAMQGRCSRRRHSCRHPRQQTSDA